jgi:hypothetical protein
VVGGNEGNMDGTAYSDEWSIDGKEHGVTVLDDGRRVAMKPEHEWADEAKLFLKKHGFTTDRRGKKHIANLPDDVVSKHNLLKSGITISNERVVHIFDGKPYMDAHVLFSNMETAIMYPSRTMLDNDPCSFKLVREYEGRYLLYVVRKFDESMDETFENTIISGRIINEKQLRKEFGKEPK